MATPRKLTTTATLPVAHTAAPVTPSTVSLPSPQAYGSGVPLPGQQPTGFAPVSARAPMPTAYGDFSWQAPTSLSAAGQFRANEGQRGIERSAAAKGTLLSGRLLKSLERYRQGVASDESQADFNRALATYTANRDTNAQNYGQQTSQFRSDLDVYGINNDAALDWARLGLQTPQPQQSSDVSTSMATLPMPTDDYAAQVASAREQNAAIDELTRRPMATLPTPWKRPIHRGAIA